MRIGDRNREGAKKEGALFFEAIIFSWSFLERKKFFCKPDFNFCEISYRKEQKAFNFISLYKSLVLELHRIYVLRHGLYKHRRLASSTVAGIGLVPRGKLRW